MFDIGRFTILCEDEANLQAAVSVIKRASEFNMIVSEDKDFFTKQSMTHHRFHNIKLYLSPPYDVYVEMQATLSRFTTLVKYSQIENPKLSHELYEKIRGWKPITEKGKHLKFSTDKLLRDINDIICEWMDEKERKEKASNYRVLSSLIAPTPVSFKIEQEKEEEEHIINELYLFIYENLTTWKPEQIKGKAIFQILLTFYKKEILVVEKDILMTLEDVLAKLDKNRREEIERDQVVNQGLSLYVPLQASDRPVRDLTESMNYLYDLHQHIISFVEQVKGEDKEDMEKITTNPLLLLQGNSGSGKSLYGRYLENYLWEDYYKNPNEKPIPLFISLPRIYIKSEYQMDIIEQFFLNKLIDKSLVDLLWNTCKNHKFVFILDGFDEIKNLYDGCRDKINEEDTIYKRFNLHRWSGYNSKFIISCRSQILNEDDIKKYFTIISMKEKEKIIPCIQIHLAPFTKEKIQVYIENFVKYGKKEQYHNSNPADHDYEQEKNEWDATMYQNALESFPGLKDMIIEPFSISLTLHVLPKLVKENTENKIYRITRARLYEAFADQWFENQVTRLLKSTDLPIALQKEIKKEFENYSKELAFEMFIQSTQVIIQPDTKENNQETVGSLSSDDDDDDNENDKDDKDDNDKHENKKSKRINNKSKLVWKRFFESEKAMINLQGSPLRRVGNQEYMFIHKSYQEYFTSKKIVQEILKFKINQKKNNNKKFEKNIYKFSLNQKLLNQEPSIIRFIVDQLPNPYQSNQPQAQHLLKDRLFIIVKASKYIDNIEIASANSATLLNIANISLCDQDWSGVRIPYANLSHTYLDYTNFNGANLSHVTLAQSSLYGTNLCNTQLEGINFGEHASFIHSKTVNDACFSPDGKTLASATFDNMVYIWDIKQEIILKEFKEHEKNARSVKFSPDGRILASASDDKIICLWDVEQGIILKKLKGHIKGVMCVSFSPDGKLLASASKDKTIRIWDVNEGITLKELTGHKDVVLCVHFSPDGKILASSSEDRNIHIWDVDTGVMVKTLIGHKKWVSGVQFSPDGKILASSSFDETICIWDLTQGVSLKELKGHIEGALCIKFSPDGKSLVSGSIDRIVRIWDVTQGIILKQFKGHTGRVCSINFSPDGKTLISSSDDKTVRIWDVTEEIILKESGKHIYNLRHVSFSSDGKTIALVLDGDYSNTILIWDVIQGVILKELKGHTDEVKCLKFSPDGKTIATGSKDKTVRLWDVSQGFIIKELRGHNNHVSCVNFSSDEKILASGSCEFGKDNDTVIIWDIIRGVALKELKGHHHIRSVTFSPNGTVLISTTYAYLCFWDVTQGVIFKMLRQPICFDIPDVHFSPDEKILAFGLDKNIYLWDITQEKISKTLIGYNGYVKSVRFSPDGKILASISGLTLRIWNVSQGTLLQELKGHTDYMLYIEFSLNGKSLFSASSDNTIRVWNLEPLLLNKEEKKRGEENENKSILIRNDKRIKYELLWTNGIPEQGLSLEKTNFTNASNLILDQKHLIQQRGGIYNQEQQQEQKQEQEQENKNEDENRSFQDELDNISVSHWHLDDIAQWAVKENETIVKHWIRENELKVTWTGESIKFIIDTIQQYIGKYR